MKSNITISCHKSNLSKIRSFVESSLKAHEISDLEIHKLVLAVDEVCANLIIHANHCDEGSNLNLSIIFYKEKVEFLIKDKGVGFNINEYREPKISEIVNSKRKGGLGLILVKRIMDHIEFSTEKNHNICRLVKNIT